MSPIVAIAFVFSMVYDGDNITHCEVISLELKNYIKPELLVLIPVLYVIGMMIKNTKKIDDRGIPALLGCCGIVLSLIYVVGTEGFNATSIFTAMTQGILVAGAAVYANQIVKQSGKEV